MSTKAQLEGIEKSAWGSRSERITRAVRFLMDNPQEVIEVLEFNEWSEAFSLAWHLAKIEMAKK